jgi:hypothetical protein
MTLDTTNRKLTLTSSVQDGGIVVDNSYSTGIGAGTLLWLKGSSGTDVYARLDNNTSSSYFGVRAGGVGFFAANGFRVEQLGGSLGAMSVSSINTNAILPITDGTSAFSIKNAGNSVYVLNVDTTNTRVGINTNVPSAVFEAVQGGGAGTFDFQKWSYDTTNYYLGLQKVVASGIVDWRFKMVDSGNTYADILTFSRGKVGIGVAQAANKFHIISTTEQLRLGYDASNYLSATVASTGSTTFALTGTTPTFTFSQGVTFSAGITLSTKDIVTDTTTGTKIGTATGQKLGFWNATPVAQQVFATGASHTVDELITVLQTLGLVKQS